MKKLFRSLVAVMILSVLFTVGFLFAQSGAKGNETKGKFHFKKTCKSCHIKDGKAKPVTPLSRTQAQWRKYFTAGQHTATQRLDAVIDAALLKDIETFLVNHASDSPQPETCGG